MMNFKSLPLLFLSLATLNACSTYSETFDCPPGRGVGCKSLSKVHQMVEKGQLPLEESPDQDHSTQDYPARTSPIRGAESKKPHKWIEAKNIHEPLNLLNRDSFSVENSNSHLKIWVTGYEDEEGHYHVPSYIYASLQKDPLETGLHE